MLWQLSHNHAKSSRHVNNPHYVNLLRAWPRCSSLYKFDPSHSRQLCDTCNISLPSIIDSAVTISQNAEMAMFPEQTRLFGSQYDQPWRGLPAEIREQILINAFSFPNEITINATHGKDNKALTEDYSAHEHSIVSVLESMLATREVHHVASRVLWENTFRLKGDCEDISRLLRFRLPAQQRLLLKHVHVDLSSETWMRVVLHAQQTRNSYLLIESTVRFMMSHMAIQTCQLTLLEGSSETSPSDWYICLGRAIIEGRHPYLRVHCKQLEPHGVLPCGTWLTGLIYSQHEQTIRSSFLLVLEASCQRYMRMRGRHDNKEIVAEFWMQADPLLQEMRNLYPFHISINELSSGRLEITLQHVGVEVAEAKIQAFARRIRQSDYTDGALHLLSSGVPNAEQRLSLAKKGLEHYKAKREAYQTSNTEYRWGRRFTPHPSP